MKASEIREKDTLTLLADIEKMRETLFKTRIGWQTGSVDNPNDLRKLRKDLARILTVLREREIAAAIAAQEAE